MTRLNFLKLLSLGLLFKDWKPFQQLLATPKYTIKKFSLGFRVSEEMLKDDLYYGKGMAEQLALVGRQHTEAMMKALA